MNSTLKAYLALVVMCICWAFSFISTKICLEFLSPTAIAFARFAIASVCLLIILKVKNESLKADKDDLIRMFAAALFGVFAYFYFENNALKYLSASIASIFLAALPIFTIVSDFLFLKIPLTKNKILAVIMSLIGVSLVAGGGNGANKDLIIGAGLILLAVIAWVIYGLMLAKISDKNSTIKTTFYQSVFGSMLFGILVLFERPNYMAINVNIWLNLLFLGLICSAFGYVIYNFAAKKLGNVTCTVFLNMMPVITIAGGIVILDECITWIQVIGSVIIISSIFLVIERKKTRRSKNN